MCSSSSSGAYGDSLCSQNTANALLNPAMSSGRRTSVARADQYTESLLSIPTSERALMNVSTESSGVGMSSCRNTRAKPTARCSASDSTVKVMVTREAVHARMRAVQLRRFRDRELWFGLRDISTQCRVFAPRPVHLFL